MKSSVIIARYSNRMQTLSNYLRNAATRVTVDVSNEASISSIMYSGDGKLSWIANIRDKEQAAC